MEADAAAESLHEDRLVIYRNEFIIMYFYKYLNIFVALLEHFYILDYIYIKELDQYSLLANNYDVIGLIGR